MKFEDQPISTFLADASQRYNYIPRMPRLVSRFLGYRESPQSPIPLWLKLVNIFLITMGALLANYAVTQYAPLYTNHWHFKTFIPSFAASCVLIYGSVEAPFSQPRNLVLGHFISGLIGVCIMKLFMTNKDNEQYLWLSGALSVTVASVVTEYTGIVHPPSGATALLPSSDDAVRNLGWNYLPVLLIHSLLFLGVALLCNNIFRRYPQYWISPPPPKAAKVVLGTEAEEKSTRYITILDEEIINVAGISITQVEQEVLKALQTKLREF